MKKGIFITFGGLALTYGAIYVSRQIALLKKICFVLNGIKIPEIGLSQIRMSIRVLLKNKSNIELNVLRQKYRIFVNDKEIITVFKRDKLKLPSKGSTETWIDIDFNPMKVLEQAVLNIIDIQNAKEKIKIRVVGFASISSFGIFTNRIPVNIEYTLKEIIDLSKSPSEPC